MRPRGPEVEPTELVGAMGPRPGRRGPALLAPCLALAAGFALAACAAEPEPLPSVYDDPALAARIDDHDGIDSVGPRFGAFVDGQPVRYWTVGGGTERAMPLYRLCRAEGGEDCVPIDHPPIVDRLPGEDGYSAFGQEHWVELPEGWSGQLGSFEEVEALIAAEGASEPRATSRLTHCPIVAADARIEVGPAGETRGAEGRIFVRGMEARCLDFTATRDNRAVLPDGTMFVRHVYVLRREPEDLPLSEPLRMQDLTGDGDRLDSNNIFGVGLSAADYTPLWKVVMVTVGADVASIDTSGDEAVADYTSVEDLFEVHPDYTITPRPGRVLDHEITETLINCPLQSAEGAL